MSSSDSPAELPAVGDSASAAGRRPPAPLDATDAVIAALDEADVAFDADSESGGRTADSSTDVIEILDAEPILAEDEPLAGAPDPVDLVTRRAKNETARDRVTMYQSELAAETRPDHQGILLHEIAAYKEQTIHDDPEEVQRAYTQAMDTHAALRPNLWALRRLFEGRSQWQSLLSLIDTEIRHAATRREKAELWTEKGHIHEDLLGEVDEAVICYRTAHELDPQQIGRAHV